MKIAICASIQMTPKIKEIAEELEKQGHEILIPVTAKRILDGKLTLEQFLKEKDKNGDGAFRKIKYDAIRGYYEKIKKMDAVLVLNTEKNNIKGYIGGNTFLEMGFAYVLKKPIYLYNDIPDMGYTDEIMAMEPIVLSQKLNKIK